MLASAPLGLLRLGGKPARIAQREYTYSGALPTRGTLGMQRVGLARIGLLSPHTAKARPKKQTGIPLRAAWQPQTAPVHVATRTAWIAPTPELFAPVMPWAEGQPVEASQIVPWAAHHTADASRRAPWAGQSAGAVAHIPARRASSRVGLARIGLAPIAGAPARTVTTQPRSAADTVERSAWGAATPVDAPRRARWGLFSQTADGAQRAPWVISHTTDSARRAVWALYAAHADAARRAAFYSARRADTPERFPFGARRALQGGWGVVIEPGTPIIEPGQPILIPIQRLYTMFHDVSVVRTADNQAISALNITLSLDADATAWSWQATLLGPDTVDAVRPDANGTPVQLAIAIDGYVFQVLVEDWTEDRTHGKRGVTAKGRGLSAQLATPYQLASSGVTASDMSLQQVLNAHLPIGTPWTIAWAPNTPDWLVPAGAWSWSNQSPLAAIFAACNGVGLVVRPDVATQTLTIQPRYPVLPWAFAAATPDITVPDAAILALSRRNAPPSQANAAFVAGGNVGGVLARVYRDGTAGDKALAAAQHPLITHTDAARLLGSRLLAAQAQQPDVRSLSIPLDGSTFGLAQLGQLVEAQIGSTTSRGLVNAVQIDVQRTDKALTVRQSLTLGEDTPNVWAGFARLLPQDPLRPATVQAAFSDGTARVQYPDGGAQRVRNPIAAAAGSSVYVIGGRIDSTAPALTQSDITV